VIGAIGDGAQAVGEGAVGIADGASFGLASDGLGAAGVHVNSCSGFYRAGGWVPTPSPTSWINKGRKVANIVGGARSGRGKNRLQFDPRAVGDHTTFRRGPDGRVTHYQDWHRNPQNPNGARGQMDTDDVPAGW
jgi:hypothetical protein